MARHDTDPVSLIAGLLFLAIAAAWAVDKAGVVPNAGRWLVPLVLIAVGVVGLVSARPRRNRDEP